MGLLARRHPKVHVFPSFLAVLLEKKDFTKWLYTASNRVSEFCIVDLFGNHDYIIFLKICLSDFAWVLFSFCTGNHWILLIANTVEHTVTVLDSLYCEKRCKKYLDKHICD